MNRFISSSSSLGVDSIFSGGVPFPIVPCVVNGAYRRRKRMMSLPTNRHAALRELLAIREFLAGPAEDQRQLRLCRIRVQVAMRLDSIQENGAHVPDPLV